MAKTNSNKMVQSQRHEKQNLNKNEVRKSTTNSFHLKPSLLQEQKQTQELNTKENENFLPQLTLKGKSIQNNVVPYWKVLGITGNKKANKLQRPQSEEFKPQEKKGILDFRKIAKQKQKNRETKQINYSTKRINKIKELKKANDYEDSNLKNENATDKTVSLFIEKMNKAKQENKNSKPMKKMCLYEKSQENIPEKKSNETDQPNGGMFIDHFNEDMKSQLKSINFIGSDVLFHRFISEKSNNFKGKYVAAPKSEINHDEKIRKQESPVIHEMKKRAECSQASSEQKSFETIKDETSILTHNNSMDKSINMISPIDSLKSSSNSNEKMKDEYFPILPEQNIKENSVKIEEKNKIENDTFISIEDSQRNKDFIFEEGKSKIIQGKEINWKSGQIIGTGKFSQVIKAFNVDNGAFFAVKRINIEVFFHENKDALLDIQEEIKLLKKLEHKNIVKQLGNDVIDQILQIQMEFISGGNLQTIIAKQGILEEATIRTYSKQILLALDQLHSQYILHGDLKGANILVDDDGTLKLSDFGCSKHIPKCIKKEEEKNTYFLKIQGSIPWLAPEIIKQIEFSVKGDIWSFGCTLIEMASGNQPWADYKFDNPVTAIMKIATSNDIPNIPEGLSFNLKELIKACLVRDPSKRPSAKELLQFKFFNKVSN